MKLHPRKYPSSIFQTTPRLLPILAAGLVLVWSLPVSAGDKYFIATGSGERLWSDGTYWQGGLAPEDGDSIYFASSSASGSQASTNDLTAGSTFAGIFYSAARNMTIGGNAIKLSGNIQNTVSNRALTLNVSAELLAGNHEIRVDSTLDLGVIIGSGSTTSLTGAGSITKVGDGTLAISGSDISFTGGLTVNAGTVRAYQGTSTTYFGLGPLVVNSGATVQLSQKSVEVRELSGAGTIGNYTTTSNASTLTVNTVTTNNVFSGLVVDGATGRLAVTKSNTGTFTLSGTANTYTGATSITGGVLEAAILADGGQASSIGQSTNAAANLVINGGTLRHTGAASSTDRLFTIGSNGATLDASGSGALSFSGSGAVTLGGANNTPHQLQLTGSNTGLNTFGLAVGDRGTGATSVIKSGVGTWVLSADSTYTGGTTITAGTLLVNGQNEGSEVTVEVGGTLGGHGSVAAISGAGSVAPGNSPGILTAPSVDPLLGLDFNFEFTQLGAPDYANAGASGNDVLRLTDAAPFLFDLTADNVVTIDFSALTLGEGDVFQGGFYADGGDFLTGIANATFSYIGLGGFSVQVSTVQQFADFAGGSANGYVTQFTVVPEPRSTAYIVLSVIGLALVVARRRRA